MARALRALARREHTRVELAHKLRTPSRWAGAQAAACGAQSASEPPEAQALDALIQAVLDDLQARGWLSEARVVEGVLHSRAPRLGWRRLRAELQQRGVSDDALQAAAAELRESELGRAQAVWARRFGSAPRDARERAAQARFMLARGFEAATLRAIWQAAGGPTDAAEWPQAEPDAAD